MQTKLTIYKGLRSESIFPVVSVLVAMVARCKLGAPQSVTATTSTLAVSCRFVFCTLLAVASTKFDNACVTGRGEALQHIHVLG